MAKTKPTTQPIEPAAPQSDLYPKQDYCYVCSRVPWGECAYLGLGHWRHVECFPGSASWVEHYPTWPAHKKSEEGDRLYEFFTWQKSKGKKPSLDFYEER